MVPSNSWNPVLFFHELFKPIQNWKIEKIANSLFLSFYKISGLEVTNPLSFSFHKISGFEIVYSGILWNYSKAISIEILHIHSNLWHSKETKFWDKLWKRYVTNNRCISCHTSLDYLLQRFLANFYDDICTREKSESSWLFFTDFFHSYIHTYAF